MTPWLGLLAGSAAVGGCLVGLLVAPRRSQLLAFLGMASGAVILVMSFARIAERSNGESTWMAVLFSVAGLAGGYWTAAAGLTHVPLSTADSGPSSAAAVDPTIPALIILSCAEAEHYRIGSTAEVVDRLTSTGALRLPTGSLPMVFLAEKTRYRAIGGYNPGRAGIQSVADHVAVSLGDRVGHVRIAWCTGHPKLKDVASDLQSAGYRSAVLLVLGPDGSLPIVHAEHDAFDTAPGLRLVHAQSIWRSDRLAERLVERILKATTGAEPGAVGVLLVGEGLPESWAVESRRWCETENYFHQRVRLMLAEHAISEQNVRIGSLEWQVPDVTETMRHLAAMGCTRIVVAPATMPHVTLASALDLGRAIDSARLSDDVRIVVLTPWGDDEAVSSAIVDSVLRALRPVTDKAT